MSSSDVPQKHRTASQRFSSLVIKLQALGRRQPVYDEDQATVIEIMRSLKRSGFTNEDISELSGGAWSIPAIKKYTRGEKTQDSTFRDEAMSHLLKMVSMGMTLERVNEVVSMNIALLGRNIDFADIGALVTECNNAGANPQDLIEMHKRLVQLEKDSENDTQSDALLLSLRSLKELLSYKAELDKLGVDIRTLVKIIEVAKQYGNGRGPAGIFEAIGKFGDLAGLLKEIEDNKLRKTSLDTLINKLLPDRIKELEEQKRTLEEPLRIFNEILKPNGFDENVLAKIAQAARKYHSQGGIGQVMEAVQSYIILKEIEQEVSDRQDERDGLEREIEKIQTEKAHLITVIEMCDFLMFNLKFSVPAIQDLVNIAKTYGSDSPVEVFNALARYGEILKLKQDIDSLTKEKAELEAKVGELEKHVNTLNAQAGQVSGLVQSAIVPMKEEYAKGADQLASTFATQLETLKAESSKKAERMAAEKIFAEELSMARLFASISRYPHELLEVPIGITIPMLDSVIRFCYAKGVDPKVTLMDFMGSKYTFNPETLLPASHLLKWARDLIGSGRR